MPPPDAVKAGKVAPLSDEDRRTIVRWIDLGCPIDLDPQYQPTSSEPRSYGWMGDDQRPTVTLTYPATGKNDAFDRILVGMTDVYSGLDTDTFRVTADFAVNGSAPGENLATSFKPTAPGVWELRLSEPIKALERGTLTVSVKDRQGNLNRVVRQFSVSR
jgi:hypothetical protein